jgi:hypothetical protein
MALQRQALEEVGQLQASWREESGGDLLAVAALTLAHWTVWASRRAKWHRAEAAYTRAYQTMGAGQPARRPRTRHWSQEDRWYSLKDQALRLLARTGWLEARLYQPEWLWIEELCADHYEDWCEERGYLHTSFGEYVLQHAKDLSHCSKCRQDPWHYALYSLELRPPFLPEDVSYRFHVPYSIGSAYLPKPGNLARVVEAETDEGLFRFGRPLEDDEVTQYSAPFIERHLVRALDELGGLLGEL